MKSLFTLFLFCLIVYKLSAQDSPIEFNDKIITGSFEPKLTGIFINPDTRLSEKCITKEWLLSEILLYNNEIVKNKYLKYNGFDDSFIMWESSSFRAIRLERELIKEVKMKNEFDNSYMIFRPIKIKLINSGNEYTFLNVLIEGKISIYVYKHIAYYKVDDGPQPNFQFILKKQDGSYSIFKPNKAGFLSQFPEKKKELKKIITRNRLKIKKEKDLIKAVELFNMTLTD